MRKLASIRRILKLQEIPKADKIEVATIDGWQCVVKRGDFLEGDLCVFLEIDSLVPEHEVFEFMRPRKFRVKTAKFMKQISQGLALPLLIIEQITGKQIPVEEGTDVTELLGVVKHDPYLEKEKRFSGKKQKKNFITQYMLSFKWFRNLHYKYTGRGNNFPWFLSKTDEERIQNLPHIFRTWGGIQCYETEKIHGMSATYAVYRGKFFLERFLFKDFYVCSRNLALYKEDDSEWWEIARRLNIKGKLQGIGKNIAIQGEICGKGIHKDPYKIGDLRFFVFNVIDIDTNKRFNLHDKLEFCKNYGFDPVPFITRYTMYENFTVDGMIERSKNRSSINPSVLIEGIVVRNINDDHMSFKAINPEFLLKYEE